MTTDSSYNEELLKFIESNKIGIPSYSSYKTTTEGFYLAKDIMLELVRSGTADFLLLKNDKVNAWWQELVQEATKKLEKKKLDLLKYELKLSAYKKLTSQERTVLGMRKPVKPKE